MSNDFKERYQSILDTVSAYNIPMQPPPYGSNQEKQIELMVEMVNKQSELINKQSELIEIIHKESVSSKYQSIIAITISVLSLAIAGLQTALQLML